MGPNHRPADEIRKYNRVEITDEVKEAVDGTKEGSRDGDTTKTYAREKGGGKKKPLFW